MPSETRKRVDPRGEATRTALIEAAESLFAHGGVEAVSTRQIGAAIGSSNTNVVAYHFGSKDALIREVYRYRLPEIDRRRSALLEGADAAGQGDQLRVLVRLFFLPLFEQTDGQGEHSYARFLAGLERSGMIETRGEVSAEFPVSDNLFKRILACLPEAAEPLFPVRIRLVMTMVGNAFQQIDREAASAPEKAEWLFENAISMATAALAAPAPPKNQFSEY